MNLLQNKLRKRLRDVGLSTAYIEPDSPRQNDFRENFTGKMRDELLNKEMAHAMFEVEVLTRK